MPAEDRGNIDHLVIQTRVPRRNRRNHFQPGQDLLDIGSDFALYRAHNDVLPALLAAAAFVEHAE